VLHPPTLLFLFYGYEEINNLKWLTQLAGT
jgi:hypothetical protein